MTGSVIPLHEPLSPSAPTPLLSHPLSANRTCSPIGRRRDSEGDREADAGLRADIGRARPAVTVISLTEAVDIATADGLTSALTGAVSAGGTGGRTVLELNSATFLGACGLGVILGAQADAVRRGGSVALIVADVSPAAATLRILPPGRCPEIYSTLTALLHDCVAPA